MFVMIASQRILRHYIQIRAIYQPLLLEAQCPNIPHDPRLNMLLVKYWYPSSTRYLNEWFPLDLGGGGFGEMEAEMMVVELWWAAMGRQPEGRAARGGEWIWGSGRSVEDLSLLYDFCGSPENSPERFSGGGWPEKVAAGRREGWPDNWGR
ncbi:hypothetical protein Tco_0295478 [Tanacetum coccineum]